MCATCALQHSPHIRQSTGLQSIAEQPLHAQFMDPFQVKDLLESGHTLHLPLMNTLLDRFAAFVQSVSMTKPNAYLLPIFTFVQKCCGISDAALQRLLERYKLSRLVFGPAPAHGCQPITPLNRQQHRVHQFPPSSPALKHVSCCADVRGTVNGACERGVWSLEDKL